MKTPKIKSAPEAVTQRQVRQAQRQYDQLVKRYEKQAAQQQSELQRLMTSVNQSAAADQTAQAQVIDLERQQQEAQQQSQQQFSLAQLAQAAQQQGQLREQSILTQNDANLARNREEDSSRRAAFTLSNLITIAQRNRR